MIASVVEFLGSAWWFIVTAGVLVTLHEYGHFVVARRCGVRVERFSVGFGRALWSRVARDGTEYRVAVLPLGGYVKMLDTREHERPLPADEARVAFDRQSPWKRIAITAAGPFVNFLLCVLLLWVALMLGVPETAPLVGQPSGLAAEAGFVQGDSLQTVDGKPAPSWDQAILPLVLAAIDHRPIVVGVRDADGHVLERRLDLSRLPEQFDQTQPLAAIGLHPLESQDRPVVGLVQDDAAARGLLRPGDEILAIEGGPIAHFSEITPRLQAVATAGKALRVDIRRNGHPLAVAIEPRLVQTEAGRQWLLGVGNRPPPTLFRYSAGPAFAESLRRTGAMARSTFAVLGRLLTGRASTKNVSGMITIAQVAHAEADVGPGRLLAFMASLSLALCILNLLPIPVLDGGHLLYYLIELAVGRPLSDRVLVAGQYLGLALLAGLITLAFYNDITRLFGRSVS